MITIASRSPAWPPSPGTLKTRLIDGFTPSAAQEYHVLTYGTLSGDFATKNLQGVAGTFPNPGVYFNPTSGVGNYTLSAGVTHNGAFNIASDATLSWTNGVTIFGAGTTFAGLGAAQFNPGTYNL